MHTLKERTFMKTFTTRKRMRLVTAIAMVVAAALLAAGSVAQADQPTIVPSPNPDYVDTTSCPFPVSIQFTGNETAKTFSSGTTIITGPLVADYSANGKNVSLNISGPGRVTVSGGSVFVLGHGVGAGPLVTPNGLVLSYTAGQVDISTSPILEGVLVHGTDLLDICAALAP